MIDIDHFKIINDTYGHQAGDKVLKAFSDYLKVSLRKEDIIGRWGGEEFIILLKTNLANAKNICETMRKHMNKIKIENENIHISASFGLAGFDGTGIDMVIGNADRALYEAKRKGRDRVETSEELVCPWRCDREN